MRKTVIAGLLFLAACATKPAPQPPPKETSATALVDRAGDSVETAVAVPADAPNEGIDFENNWIYDRYGRFRRQGGGIAHAGEGAALRSYEVVKIELADHSERTVYFDITENEKTWQTSRPKPH